MTRKNLNLLIASVFVLISILFGLDKNISPVPKTSSFPDTFKPHISPPVFSDFDSASLVKVVKVIDGDTIEIEGGNKVRYIGIDTPESVDKRRGIQCFGREAADKNNELVLNKYVTLEKDVSEKDGYGRFLRYVYSNGIMINNELVKQGFAKVSTYPPDVKYQETFLESEKYARNNNLGMWANCQ